MIVSLCLNVLDALLILLSSHCRLVADAAGGKYIEQVPCSPPPRHMKMDKVLSEKVL